MKQRSSSTMPWKSIPSIVVIQSRAHEKDDERIEHLVWLLNVDDGEPAWKRRAHGYAKKIIIKLACQGKLDDCSMACLLKLPQTTSIACEALSIFCFCSNKRDFDETKAFSITNAETMKTLLTLVDDNAVSTTRQAAVCFPLMRILDGESKDTILNVAAKWVEILAMDANPILQISIMNAFEFQNVLARGPFVVGSFTGILEVLLGLYIASKDYEVRKSAGQTLMWFCTWKGPAVRIAAIPGAIAKVINLFISKETPHESSSIVGAILGLLLCVPQNRIRLGTIEGYLEGLGDILANTAYHWRATCDEDKRKELEKRATLAAGILAQLALENELNGTTASLPGAREGLLFLQLVQMARFLTVKYGTWHHRHYRPVHATRALAILYPDHPDLPPLERIQKVFSNDGGPLSSTSSVAEMYVRIYWTRVGAHLEMGAYKADLENLDLAYSYLYQLIGQILTRSDLRRLGYVLISNPWYEASSSWWGAIDAFSFTRIFLLAKLKDHAGALLAASTIPEKHTRFNSEIRGLIEKAIIKRLFGDLQGALDDLNVAYIEACQRCYARERYDILKHLGHVKYLMRDEVGAREDAEAAQQLGFEYVEFDEKTIYFERSCLLQKQPLNYLGYFL